MSKHLLSRRRFVQRCSGVAAAPLLVRLAAGQNSPPPTSERTTGPLEITLLKSFEGVQLLAVSPDSTHICVYAFRHLETFLRPWSYDGGNTKRIDDTLRIINLPTGDLVYATQLRSMVVNASFFASSDRLYAETMPLVEREGGRATVFQQAVIDLETRSLEQRLCPLGSSYVSLSGSHLLGYEFSLQTSQLTSLIIATLPDYRIGPRAPFAVVQEPAHYGRPVITGRGMAYGHDTTPVVSSDRKTVVYGTGHSIVCRRTSDLDVLWTHPIEPDYVGAWMLDLTPDGSRVVAAIVGGSSVADRDKFYVGVYDGKDGSVVTRLPLNGREGVAISPDGKLVAVSQQVALADGRVEPTVGIFEIASGNQVGKVSHQAAIVSGFGNSGKGAIGSRFTPDGKYLITSGVSDAMVWTIQG